MVSLFFGSFSRVITALDSGGRIWERIWTALSRNPPGLLRKSRIIPMAQDFVIFFSDVANSSSVCSQKKATSIYPILHVSIFSWTEGMSTLSRVISVVFSVLFSHRIYFTIIFDHFGHLILSTAISVFIPTSRVVSIIVSISPFLSQPISAGEFLNTFWTFIPLGFSSITAPIHSKSHLKLSLKSAATFGGKYELCLSPTEATSAVINWFSISSFLFSEKW